jgi:mitogen-activated protein kinase 1/3
LGLARGFNEEEDEMKTVYVVTRWYRAPELLVSSQSYNAKIDVWAAGCILAEMLGRRPLFPGEDYMNQLTIIINMLGTPEEKDVGFITSRAAREYMTTLDRKTKTSFAKLYPAANPKAIDLLDKMLCFNPDKRCTV